MIKALRGRKKRLVLDIGTSAIRVAELSQTKTGYQLTKYIRQEYDADPAHDDAKKKELRAEALAKALKESKIRAKKTIFGVPGQSVFTRSRSLPPVPEYKVTQIVRYEIQQQIPFGLDQIAMDYQILDRTEAGGYDVMMAAIKTDVVEKHLDILKTAKRMVDVVDVSPLAAYNWLKHTGEFGDGGECVALIDMGATTTDIVIERDNQFRFTRPLNVGGNDVTRAVATAFGLNFSDAEKLKRQRGFAPTGDPERDGKGGQVIGEVLQRMVGEIMRSFAYFRSLPGGGQVNRVVLCGGGACLRNIIPYMQSQLGVEVRIAQPLSGLAITPGAQQVNEAPEESCVALGLALRTREVVPLEINLIPPRVLEAARRREQVFYWALALSALALIMASIIPDRANKDKAVQEEIELLEQNIRFYDPFMAANLTPGQPPPRSQEEAKLQAAKREISNLEKHVEWLDKARIQRRFWLDELTIINNARPGNGGLWISSAESTNYTKPQNNDGPGGGGGGGGRPGMARGPLGMPSMPSMGGMGGMGRAGGGRSGPRSSNNTGFQGIDSPEGPHSVAAPINSGGRRGGGRGSFGPSLGRPGMPGIGRPGGGGRNRGGDQSSIPFSNGMILFGLAESDQIIKEYVEQLKASDPMPTATAGLYALVQHVDFDESSVQKVMRNALCEAPTSLQEANQWRVDSNVYLPASESLYTFEITVQIVRTYELPGRSAGAQQANAGGQQG